MNRKGAKGAEFQGSQKKNLCVLCASAVKSFIIGNLQHVLDRKSIELARGFGPFYIHALNSGGG